MNKYPQSKGQVVRHAAPLGLLACLLVWGCCGCDSSDRASSSAVDAPAAVATPPAAQTRTCAACVARSQAQARSASPAAKAGPSDAATPPIMQVTGERAQCDLGTVKAGSKHRVIFAIHNDSDKPLKLLKIRGDCSCITSAEAPESIAPGQVARVVAIFDAPDINVPYGAELIVMTDNPLRKIIRLAVGADIHR